MNSDMGDGDLADFDDAGTDETDGVSSTGAANTAPVDDHDASGPEDLDDDEVRSGELDELVDVTGGTERPGDEPDYSDVDVAALLAEREEYKQIAQRIQADFDNFRKRTVAQLQVDVERATGRLAEALLPVLDAAEAAFLRHPDEVGPLLNQMLTELKKQGLETLDLDGQPFDPEVAEAVHHEPGSGGEPVVAEVLRSGYRWKSRTLRPAMVKTSD